jgi:hypothetical protein
MKAMAFALAMAVCVPSCAAREVEDTTFYGSLPVHVEIEPLVLEALSSVWAQNEQVGGPEFLFCPVDHIVPLERGMGTAYVVTGFSVIRPDSATRDQAIIPEGACEGSRGMGHSHPAEADAAGNVYLTCGRSPTSDVSSFWSRGLSYGIVLCGPGSYRYYTRNGEQGGAGAGDIPYTVRVR